MHVLFGSDLVAQNPEIRVLSNLQKSELIEEWMGYPVWVNYLDPRDVEDCFAQDFAENRHVDRNLVENCIKKEHVFPPSIWDENVSISKKKNPSFIGYDMISP